MTKKWDQSPILLFSKMTMMIIAAQMVERKNPILFQKSQRRKSNFHVTNRIKTIKAIGTLMFKTTIRRIRNKRRRRQKQ